MFVSNASTLILIAKASVLKAFLDQAGPVAIPEQVHHEAVLGKEVFDARLIKSEIDNKRIVVERANSRKMRAALMEFRLDAGEAAAYALYSTKKHTALMTDDAELIKLCKVREIPFFGALAAVVMLYRNGVLSKSEAVEKLAAVNACGRYSQSVYEYFHKLIVGG